MDGWGDIGERVELNWVGGKLVSVMMFLHSCSK